MLTVFFECVDSHNGEIRVVLCVGGEVEVDHFLHDFVVGEGSPTHFGEDGRCVHAEGHVANDFFDDLPSFFGVVLIDDIIEGARCRDDYFLSSFISPFFFSSKYWEGLEGKTEGLPEMLILLQIYYLIGNISVYGQV